MVDWRGDVFLSVRADHFHRDPHGARLVANVARAAGVQRRRDEGGRMRRPRLHRREQFVHVLLAADAVAVLRRRRFARALRQAVTAARRHEADDVRHCVHVRPARMDTSITSPAKCIAYVTVTNIKGIGAPLSNVSQVILIKKTSGRLI